MQNGRGEGSENEQIAALYEMHPDKLQDIEFLDDSSEFEIIKSIFHKCDWKYVGGMGVRVIGKNFEQINFYCKRAKAHNLEYCIELIHYLGKIWASEANKREEKWQRKN